MYTLGPSDRESQNYRIRVWLFMKSDGEVNLREERNVKKKVEHSKGRLPHD